MINIGTALYRGLNLTLQSAPHHLSIVCFNCINGPCIPAAPDRFLHKKLASGHATNKWSKVSAIVLLQQTQTIESSILHLTNTSPIDYFFLAFTLLINIIKLKNKETHPIKDCSNPFKFEND